MAKKNIYIETDFTWDGTTDFTTFKGKTYSVNSADEVWSETDSLWSDNVVSILKRITYGGSRGGLRKKQDTWNAWNNINEADKKKIVKVILTLKGVRHEAVHDINEYKVTIDDIDLVLEEYEKYKVTIENVEIK